MSVETTDPKAATEALCEALDHQFGDPTLLEAALTHRSWRNEHPEAPSDNQRLEFLGDAVIDLIVARHLFDELDDSREGVLTVLKSSVVDEGALAALAREIGLGPALRLGKGERLRGGRELPSVLSDGLEALFGALLIDAGYGRTREIALRLFGHALDAAVARARGDENGDVNVGVCNYKTAVQEVLQGGGEKPPVYSVTQEEGPPHDRVFSVCASATWRGQAVSAEGVGRTKKMAENTAASGLIAVIGGIGGEPQSSMAAADGVLTPPDDKRGADPAIDAPLAEGDPSGI